MNFVKVECTRRGKCPPTLGSNAVGSYQYLGSHSYQIVQIMAQGAFYRELNGTDMQERQRVCCWCQESVYQPPSAGGYS